MAKLQVNKRKPKGTGSITKLPSGTLMGVVSLGYDSNKKRIRKSVYGKTQEEVRTKMYKLILEYKNNPSIVPSSITISDIIKTYQKNRYESNNINSNTYRRHLDTIKTLEPISSIEIQKITEKDLRTFVNDLVSYSQSSINKIYQMLKKTFELAIDQNLIQDNLMSKIEKPKSKTKQIKTRALTLEEEKKLLGILVNNPNINFRNQMLLSLFTGMRMGEINALQINDINFKTNTINIDKTISRSEKTNAIINERTKTEAGERTINMDPPVVNLIKSVIKGRKDGLLFTKNGKLITTIAVNDQFQRLIKQYHIIDYSVKGKLSQHSLRHTYATRCIEAGMSAKILQRQLGHTEISITLDTYCDAFNEFYKKDCDKSYKYMKEKGFFNNLVS